MQFHKLLFPLLCLIYTCARARGGAIGVTLSWLYNRSDGSILAVGLLHASLNTSVIFLPQTGALDALLIVLAVLVTILDRMWIGHPDDRREEERPLPAKDPVLSVHRG